MARAAQPSENSSSSPGERTLAFFVRSFRFSLRQVLYDLDESLLFRPAAVTLGLALTASILPVAEERVPILREFSRHLTWVVPQEPSAVQVVVGTIAGSVMTVVSIVYSVLLVTLSLSSAQFSPRILTGFMRDRRSQKTLGLFIGTFVYCLLVLRSARSEPLFIPEISVALAILLALGCMGSLIFFVHHMVRAMQANYIVDRIAGETEAVVDDVFRHAPGESREAPACPEDLPVVRAPSSGYVQLIDSEALCELAVRKGWTLFVERAMGQFIPEGGVIVRIAPSASGEVRPSSIETDDADTCINAFDLGPVRTMQEDAEFGIRQIVDIALKAISPAINDPSTCNTCIDHLGRILARIARSGDCRNVLVDAGGTPRVVLPSTSFRRALDLAVNQIRQYGRNDMAVLLRLVRMLSEVASVAERPDFRAALERQLGLIDASARDFLEEDRSELSRVIERLRATIRRWEAPPAP